MPRNKSAITVNVQFTVNEHAWLLEQAKQNNTSVPKFIRQLVAQAGGEVSPRAFRGSGDHNRNPAHEAAIRQVIESGFVAESATPLGWWMAWHETDEEPPCYRLVNTPVDFDVNETTIEVSSDYTTLDELIEQMKVAAPMSAWREEGLKHG